MSSGPRITPLGTVDAVARDLRRRILDGEIVPGGRLPERELTDYYDVARHSVRAALRQLAAQRLVRIEPNRGASVALLDHQELAGLYELRAALETEALRLLQERHGFDPWPDAVQSARANLDEACAQADRSLVDEAHADLHHALVDAAGSDRITQAHADLDAETRIYLLQLRPAMSPADMAETHRLLLADLRTHGPEAIRAHVASATALLT